MSNGQVRVLVLFGLLVGLQLSWSPLWPQLAQHQPITIDGHALRQGALALLVAGIALLALASFAPAIATWIVVLFLALGLLNHSKQTVGFFSGLTTGVQNLAGGSGTGG